MLLFAHAGNDNYCQCRSVTPLLEGTMAELLGAKSGFSSNSSRRIFVWRN